MNSANKLVRVGVLFLMALAVAGLAQAQTDFSGEWAIRLHEDEPHRQAGPNAEVPGRHGIELGDYTGMPINAAARLMADSWDASIQTLPEHQLEPAGAALWVAGVGNLRISKIVNDETQDVVAFKIFRSPGTTTTRMIWLDGRPHPPEYAPHTWEGFSTGYWEGNMLTVETTHLKRAYLQLNGIYVSDQATLVEHFVRHGNYLTVVSVVTDPLYLDEPYIRSSALRTRPISSSSRGRRASKTRWPGENPDTFRIICRERTSSSGSSASAWVCRSRRLGAARKRSTRNTS